MSKQSGYLEKAREKAQAREEVETQTNTEEVTNENTNAENDEKSRAEGTGTDTDRSNGEVGGETNREQGEHNEEEAQEEVNKATETKSDKVTETKEEKKEDEEEEQEAEITSEDDGKNVVLEIKKERLEYDAEKYIDKNGYDERILKLINIKGVEKKKDIRTKIDNVNAIITSMANDKVKNIKEEVKTEKVEPSKKIIYTSNVNNMGKTSTKKKEETGLSYGQRLAQKFGNKK